MELDAGIYGSLLTYMSVYGDIYGDSRSERQRAGMADGPHDLRAMHAFGKPTDGSLQRQLNAERIFMEKMDYH